MKYSFIFLFLFITEAHAEKLNSVVIRYKAQNGARIEQSNAQRPQIIELMSEKVNALQSQVLQSRSFAAPESFKSLWLIQSSVAKLTDQEILHVQSLSEVQSVRRARKARIVPTILSARIKASDSYTYGLKKVKVPELRLAQPNLLGQGAIVGIIDTGIDANHPDLKGKLNQFRNFVSPQNTRPLDDHGHGSHVAGTIAGGVASGQAIGLAPEAKLVVAKGFTADGDSEDAHLLLALQWMADPDGNPATNDQPQVISNSWEVDGRFSELNPDDEPFCLAIENLASLNITAVFAAGNSGWSGANTIQLPAACPRSLSVGSTDSRDQLASSSSRGPTKWKNILLMKPELSAPGVEVYSVNTGGGYTTMSGTSMATPHVAGAMALLVQANPTASVETLRELLLSTTLDLGEKGQDAKFGFGRLDIFQAVKVSVP